ncbi:SIMPL domain-containing protein [Novosphingobium colocasiae]|uniref:SIMPL domain-containing protein n=1 Tax=Novosphingobium colocasiae TaxID=1256513 RepID=A0A918PE24_9SPHN|nr:SIMPL domain-containing protein [Novosphingobium colocasiae]GGZ02163.1 SIMPL domain-containing protein [Novosphingobium colocasiae]
MRKLALLAAASLIAALPVCAAQAQDASVIPAIAAGHTLLTVSAQGASTRTPDMAGFSAGVTTQGATASEALTANSAAMAKVIAALKRAGVADKDIQTSTINLNPQWAQPKRLPDGSYEDAPQRIIGYQANNSVNVRARKLDQMGKVIDALVSAGANQVNGPNFMLAEQAAAEDEARVDAIKAARARAELYARAAGLRVVRIVSINEGGGYARPMPMMYAKADMVAAAPPPAPPPVAAGELETSVTVSVAFELAP